MDHGKWNITRDKIKKSCIPYDKGPSAIGATRRLIVRVRMLKEISVVYHIPK